MFSQLKLYIDVCLCEWSWVKPAFLSSVSESIYIYTLKQKRENQASVSFASAWRMFCISNSYNWTGVGEIWQEERQAGCVGEPVISPGNENTASQLSSYATFDLLIS